VSFAARDESRFLAGLAGIGLVRAALTNFWDPGWAVRAVSGAFLSEYGAKART
jgi:hypothetical protein